MLLPAFLFPVSSPDTPASVGHSASNHSAGNVISKYLVAPSSSTPACRKPPLPRARLLTSATTLQILEKKERKKQEEAQLKLKEQKGRRENR